MLRLLLFFCVFTQANILLAQQSVDISIFTAQPSDHYVFRVLEGRYYIADTDGSIYRFPQHKSVHIAYKNNAFEIRTDSLFIGTLTRPYFRALDDFNTFFIVDAAEKYPARQYDDDLSFQWYNQKVRLVNHVGIEKYVAGVVESEVGHFKDFDFFQAQSVIVRAYAFRNREKHFDEGFNLCDAVHCQAYKSRAYYKNAVKIQHAVMSTKDLVILDQNNTIIDATFFANCGGNTANSEDVWSSKVPYLRAVKDPHCVHSGSWEKELDRKEVERYLGITLEQQTILSKSVKYFPKTKKKLTAFRSAFHLPSCDFRMVKKRNTLMLYGRGRGHGVGLCQEGAAAMGVNGFSFPEILHFYYKNIFIGYIDQ